MTSQLKNIQQALGRKLPDWLKVPLPSGKNFYHLKSLIKIRGLNTVCESASCPNIGTCWEQGNLTLMILGEICTRACRFCDVLTGAPQVPRSNEPEIVADMLSKLNLRYVVITSVDRDDLNDGGSAHWAKTIREIRKRCPKMKLETLIPDFSGKVPYIKKICEAGPDVLSHNLETVASLQSKVRPQCRYEWSLKALKVSSNFGLKTKSGLMLGMGETREEVIQTMSDLVDAGCCILTLGQYLRPSRKHLEVTEYIHPEIFEEYKMLGESMGFQFVESGPLVRSSYLAEKQAEQMAF